MGSKWLRVVMVMISVLVLEAGLSNGCWEQERFALLQLKSFFVNLREEEGSNCCLWERVECNIITKRVTKLSLNYTFWSGEKWYLNASLFLPFEELRSLYLNKNGIAGCVVNEGFGKLSKLSRLEVLDLSYNQFNASILSSLSKISSLKSLSLARNDLFTRSNHTNDLKWLSRLSSLKTLDLSATNVKNNSLLHLGSLSSLTTLILSKNYIEGTVDLQEFYKLKNLTKLDLSINRIGSLQSFHGKGRQLSLINLEVLDLSDNFFNNSILADLGGFSNLKSLNIKFNQLNGSINIKEFCVWSNLETLDMSYNAVNQFITSKENERQVKLINLEVLDLSGNYFNNSILADLSWFPNLKSLNIYENQLKGSVDVKELCTLSNLETLDMSYIAVNQFVTSKGWCYLKSLEELSLYGNAIWGEIVSCLGNLTFLRYLDISYNQFIGNVASTPLTNLTMLQYLSLSNNHFQVPVSFMSFANHSNLKILFSDENKLVEQPVAFQTWLPKFQLKVLSLSKCTIEGDRKLQLPNFLYYQYDLRLIDISNINFGGIKFPYWLVENNTRLQELYMVNNSIVGPLLLPSHPNYKLGEIDISNNKMQHQIPTNICSLFPNLEILVVSRNAFKSSIPLYLGGMKSLSYLDMSHNQLFGGIPEELAMSRSLRVLRLSNNTLSGKMFPATYRSNLLEALYLDGNNFDGDMPQISPISSSVLGTLDIRDNHLSGKLPRWLWDKTYLQILDLSNNHFEGPIPVELCNMVGLRFLDLSQNNLSGTIPSCFNLRQVQFVYLRKNNLSGPLSPVFYGSSSLVTLDLSENNFTGNIPDWNGTLPALSVLLLKANQFYGEFPVHLCKLLSLSIVDLSQNQLSGPIPSCVSNLTLKQTAEKSYFRAPYMAFNSWLEVLVDTGLKIFELQTNVYFAEDLYSSHYVSENNAEVEIVFSTKSASYNYTGNILGSLSGIDLSCNQLTGIIPLELGNLSEIRALNLSHNNLTGAIPSTFSKLKQIESLDLSYNNLNGRIPPQLTELYTLEVFIVSHNNLSGHLPDMKAQFGTFDESSYEGNPLLCGPPLKNSCSEGDSPETPISSSGEDEEHGFIDMGDFYISFGVSYAIILLGVFIVLYINPYWRRTWFYFVEERSAACYFFIVDSLHRLPCFRRNI